MDNDGYVTVYADDLPDSSLGRRLAAFRRDHSGGEDCWCDPIVHNAENGAVIAVEHHVTVDTTDKVYRCALVLLPSGEEGIRLRQVAGSGHGEAR
jgi:hypothetical protein